jgi:hypothetical protein
MAARVAVDRYTIAITPDDNTTVVGRPVAALRIFLGAAQVLPPSGELVMPSESQAPHRCGTCTDLPSTTNHGGRRFRRIGANAGGRRRRERADEENREAECHAPRYDMLAVSQDWWSFCAGARIRP